MKLNKLKIIFIEILILLISISTICFASMAEWSDEEADAQSNEEQKIQQQQDTQNAGKSSNNYLQSIEVEGYEISPEFDKQTIDYTIKDVDKEYIEISATAEDSRAIVTGTGKIELKPGENEIIISVKAENGVERAYVLKINNISNDAKSKDVSNSNEEIVANVINTENSEIHSTNNNTKISNKNIITLCIILIVIIAIIILLPKKKKGKH